MKKKGEGATNGVGYFFTGIAVFNPGDGGSVVGVADEVRMRLEGVVVLVYEDVDGVGDNLE